MKGTVHPITASKLMEHIVTKHMITYLEDNNILYDLQYGFHSKCSCETLLTSSQDILNNLRDNRQTDVIIMDFAKAFDKSAVNCVDTI